jgi:hypothetical protein
MRGTSEVATTLQSVRAGVNQGMWISRRPISGIVKLWISESFYRSTVSLSFPLPEHPAVARSTIHARGINVFFYILFDAFLTAGQMHLSTVFYSSNWQTCDLLSGKRTMLPSDSVDSVDGMPSFFVLTIWLSALCWPKAIGFSALCWPKAVGFSAINLPKTHLAISRTLRPSLLVQRQLQRKSSRRPTIHDTISVFLL